MLSLASTANNQAPFAHFLFVPKAWVPYFLGSLEPYMAYQTGAAFVAALPVALWDRATPWLKLVPRARKLGKCCVVGHRVIDKVLQWVSKQLERLSVSAVFTPVRSAATGRCP